MLFFEYVLVNKYANDKYIIPNAENKYLIKKLGTYNA